MIETLDQKTKDRVNRAISSIRFIASRTKRASILDATQKAEIVVNLLNEFRQYVAIYMSDVEPRTQHATFKHNRETLERITQATFQADSIYHMLTKQRQKSYEQEYHQVWSLLENIHAYMSKIIEGRV